MIDVGCDYFLDCQAETLSAVEVLLHVSVPLGPPVLLLLSRGWVLVAR